MKPDLTMYKGRKVTAVTSGGQDPSAWSIELEGGVVIANTKPDETFPPTPEIIGSVLETVLLSVHDTKLVLLAPNGHTHKIGLAPTYYTISDPGYGGIVYPQWPEELEESGVPATPEGGISDKPSQDWGKHEKELRERQEARMQQEAAQFLKGEDDEQS